MRWFSCQRNFAVAGVVSATLVIGALASAPARADVIVTDVEMTINPADSFDIQGNAGSPQDVYVGQVTFTTNANNTIPVWCVDIYHDIGLGGGQNIDYTVGILSTDHDGHSLSTDQINSMSWLIIAGDAYVLSHPTADVSAAIQLAIWELEYGQAAGGTGFSFSGESANVLNLATQYYNSAWAQKGNSYYDQYIYTLDNPNIQSFGAWGTIPPGGPPQLVPEPGALGLLGSGLLVLAGVGAFRKRKSRKLA
ncbi:MAG TPA: PEP-CTERM sorting domain-containing protein [Rhizomicrobium sp.]|jgi:hypothetical protein